MYDEHLSKCIQNMQLLPTEEDLQNIFHKFSDYKRVIFCTMGKSAFACRKIVYTARSYGLDWHDLDVCHAFHGDAGIIKEGDLLVFVSKSGETKETIDVAEYFSNWETVGVNSNEDSTLSKICKNNIIIPVIEEASPFGYAPMVSTTAYMVVLHGIMCKVIESSSITVKDYARNHPAGSIGKKLEMDL